jgi:hypothetical protein
LGPKNYRIINMPEVIKTHLEAWFRDRDAVDSRQCFKCGNGWRKGLYSWYCPECRLVCQHTFVIGIRRAGDSALHPCRRCSRCGLSEGDPPSNGQHELADVIIRDTLVMYGTEVCGRCGSGEGAQLHHWAPSAIFSDSWKWPTSYLCRVCHTFWHTTMRRANGYRLDVKVSIDPPDKPGEAA